MALSVSPAFAKITPALNVVWGFRGSMAAASRKSASAESLALAFAKSDAAVISGSQIR
jgi:hypothetical protein